ncbi:MAG: FAD-dependent thymidylate synthase [Thermoflexales bacterium]|nr:FAD-dependent thymidylate synthase [Thermoflexales bacterium]MDW8352553.1 FAD-dependent thymidylate synthase [Anaerolineae bacterium]
MDASGETPAGRDDGPGSEAVFRPPDRAALLGKRVAVLDKGWVELQDLMGDDLAIVNAARVSFLGESKGSEKDKRLLFYLMQHRHTSPFEQVEFKFRVRAPVVTWWQWVRHRTWQFNAQSGRYVAFDEDDFYVPDVWRKQSPSNKQASLGELTPEEGAPLTAALLEHYERGYRLYRQALDAGVAREQARIFLPGFAVYYTWVAKVDAHNLMHFLSLRMAEDAQFEIRIYARTIYEHFFKPALPWTAEAFETFILSKMG